MKEYSIYQSCNGGTPYRIHIFDNITSCKLKLYDMISLDEERHNAYFVDNNFFENKYSKVGKIKYYRIDVRDVSEWVVNNNDNNNLSDNNIIYYNFKKSVDI